MHEEVDEDELDSSGGYISLPVQSMTACVTPPDMQTNPHEMVRPSESVPNIRDTSAIYMSSMKPPPLSKMERNSPLSPGSPTQEEARRALHNLLSFLQSRHA